MLGLNRKSVELIAHQKEWKKLYEQEKRLLRAVLGDFLIAIEHVGSTAIPQISAKPIIDLIIGVKDLSMIEACLSPLAEIGYEYRGEQGIAGRPFFRKGTEAVSTHHLSVVEFGGEIWLKHLTFRDYLLEHAETARRYDELKKGLALNFKDDRVAYTNGKTEFVEEVLRAANLSEK